MFSLKKTPRRSWRLTDHGLRDTWGGFQLLHHQDESIPPKILKIKPIGSMYGIFTYIWLIFMVNVGEYTIHGSYGKPLLKCRWGGGKAFIQQVLTCKDAEKNISFRNGGESTVVWWFRFIWYYKVLGTSLRYSIFQEMWAPSTVIQDSS